MNKPRSPQVQAATVARVRAAVRLQSHRPKIQDDKTKYNRNKAKRFWRKYPEALSFCLEASGMAKGPQSAAADWVLSHLTRRYGRSLQSPAPG